MVPAEGRSDAVLQTLTFPDRSAMETITCGTVEGLELLLKIVAMLVVFVAIVSLCNAALGFLPPVGEHPLMLGWAMASLTWSFGVPWSEAHAAGALLGKTTVLNELIAYLDPAKLPDETLFARSKLLMTYGLCGFANFGSLGIMLGGMGVMVPERRGELVELGMKSIVTGLLATCLAAAAIKIVV
jgi:concentrative nucleoside transporter, CNT family